MSETEFARNWAPALTVLVGLVDEAEKSAALVWNTPEGNNKRLQLTTWNLDMGMARGALIALDAMWPKCEALKPLRERLNNCPVIAMSGPEAAAAVTRSATEQVA